MIGLRRYVSAGIIHSHPFIMFWGISSWANHLWHKCYMLIILLFTSDPPFSFL